MFKRHILFHLERWKDDTHRKPLILRGARQVGKTTVVNEFGKQFDNYLYLNLEKREAASLFELNGKPEKGEAYIDDAPIYENPKIKENVVLVGRDRVS